MGAKAAASSTTLGVSDSLCTVMTVGLEAESGLSSAPHAPTLATGGLFWGLAAGDGRNWGQGQVRLAHGNRMNESHGNSRHRMFWDSSPPPSAQPPFLPACAVHLSWVWYHARVGSRLGRRPMPSFTWLCVHPSLSSLLALSESPIPVRGQRGHAALNSFSRPWTNWSLRKSS